MRAKSLLGAMAAVALLSASAVAEDLKSGLQVGDRAGAFNVKDCTGPATGKTLCYR